MITLRKVDYLTISKYFVDFQKKAKDFDLPEDTAQSIGIYKGSELIGYFIIQGYNNTDVEVLQGYLIKKYRHQDLSKQCMAILESMCKQAGYKTMVLATGSRFKAYLRFADSLGYKPRHLEFSKEI